MLNPDFKEFIRLLNAHKVEYLVVGGYAVAYHGHPRYTKDIDIWIRADDENAGRMIRVLDDFGLASLGLRKSDFMEPDQIIQLGYPPARIDILTSMEHLRFDKCYPAGVVENIDGTDIRFIGLADLKRNKRATGRAQDLADAENLESDVN